MERKLLASILPDYLLDYFEIIDFKKLGEIATKTVTLDMEKNMELYQL